jgi:hypothetical protein
MNPAPDQNPSPANSPTIKPPQESIPKENNKKIKSEGQQATSAAPPAAPSPTTSPPEIPKSEAVSYKPHSPTPISSASSTPSSSALPPPTPNSLTPQPNTSPEPGVSYADSAIKLDSDSGTGVGIFKILSLIIVLFLLIFTGIGALIYAIAYDQIQLNNNMVVLPIRKFVLSLPFTPKPPNFLLQASTLAHSQVSSQSFNMSLAAESNQLTSSLGLNKLDMEIKGDIDFNDLKNILMDIEMAVTKDFNIYLRQKGSLLYFKINKLPPSLMTFLDPENKIGPLLENWISYDTSSLETEARQHLDEFKQIHDEQITDDFEDFFDEKILNEITTSAEELDNNKAYKLSLVANADLINHIAQKLESGLESNTPKIYDVQLQDQLKASDVIKNLKIDIWIEDQSFYTRKVVISFDIKPDTRSLSKLTPGLIPPLNSEPETTSIVIVMEFSNFGKTFNVETPKDSIKFEEFLKQLQLTLTPSTQSNQLEQNQAKLLQDMQTLTVALQLYYTDHNQCPAALNDLMPEYLSKIPENKEAGYHFSYKTGLNQLTCTTCVVINNQEIDCLIIPQTP